MRQALVAISPVQIHKRLQKVCQRTSGCEETQDDIGFCLYASRESNGSGLDFKPVADTDMQPEMQAAMHSKRSATGVYAFKPLEAPCGTIKIKVAYRQGPEPKVRRFSPCRPCSVVDWMPSSLLQYMDCWMLCSN